ncbi:MAG: UDP-3-O-(3-hydroxymyristoyl)glucosamine N-acyltransferase [Bdellovibrionales bacterium]|nr:UDP-3-O-(3-hydroxymyristoyl)glucosamine N-acyltransferase [Bdellovibrionales bacterium]
MAVQIREILENFPDLLSLNRGAPDHSVTDIQTGTTASSQSLIFVSNRQQLEAAQESQSTTWVVGKDLVTLVPAKVTTLLVSPNPYLALAQVAKRLFPLTRHHQILSGAKIHDSARVSSSAQIGRECIIGPGAVIGDDCVLGDRCIVGANSVLEPGVKLGEGTHIHPLVFIGHSCELGKNCEVHPHTSIGTEGFGYAQDAKFNHYRITHFGRVILEDGVHIGAGVNIDRGTFEDSRIGAGTKIDNHCHFGHNIQIGRNTLITAGMITAGSVTIGNACVFGGRTTVGGHISIADQTQVGGHSVVQHTVEKAGQYAGFPLQPMKNELRLRVLLKDYPEVVKQVRRLSKHLGIGQDVNPE